MNEEQLNQSIDKFSEEKDCNTDWLYNKLLMNFSAGVYDMISRERSGSVVE